VSVWVDLVVVVMSVPPGWVVKPSMGKELSHPHGCGVPTFTWDTPLLGASRDRALKALSSSLAHGPP
jgi:hypothetical protein